jgi:hypothetical protein
MVNIPVYKAHMQQVAVLPLPKDTINGNDDSANLIAPLLSDLDREHLIALYITAPNKIIGIETVAIGSSDQVTTSMRETLRGAISLGAMAILVAHNHPRGSLKPSKNDIEFTKTLQKSASIFGIQLIASLIINPEGEFQDIMSPPEKEMISLQKQMIEKFGEGNSPEYLMFFMKALINLSASGILVYLLALLIKMVAEEVQSIKEINITILTTILFCIFLLIKGIMRTMTLPVVRRWPKVKSMKPKRTSEVIEQ